jgi:sensor histidine kinase YesM
VKDWLHATWAALTWRKMLLMQALGQLAILIESTEQHLFGTWIGHPSLAYASMVLNVFLTVPVALFADAALERGAKASYAYLLAIIMTLPLAGIASVSMLWVYVLIFGLSQVQAHLWPRAVIETSFHMYIYGAFVMLVYMNQRTADRMLENFRRAELRRVQLENQLVDSRLATAEAQIDPATLFGALRDIKWGYERSPPEAEAALNTLIQSLRAALARTVAVRETEISEA